MHHGTLSLISSVFLLCIRRIVLCFYLTCSLFHSLSSSSTVYGTCVCVCV